MKNCINKAQEGRDLQLIEKDIKLEDSSIDYKELYHKAIEENKILLVELEEYKNKIGKIRRLVG